MDCGELARGLVAHDEYERWLLSLDAKAREKERAHDEAQARLLEQLVTVETAAEREGLATQIRHHRERERYWDDVQAACQEELIRINGGEDRAHRQTAERLADARRAAGQINGRAAEEARDHEQG